MADSEDSKNFDPFTDGLEVASSFRNIIKGKTVLITGVAEGGLGGEAALTIATASPSLLILSARSASRAQPVAAKITSEHLGVIVRVLPMDLTSLTSVRAAAGEVESWKEVKIDVIINSAAIMAAPYSKTEDGFESQFGICHLAHFLFVNLLLRDGKVADGGRVVNVSSLGHRFSDVRFNDPGFEDGKVYDPWRGYGQAKTANMLFSVALADSKMLRKKGILSFSLHPGGVMTNLGKFVMKDREASMAGIAELDKMNGISDDDRKVVRKTLQQGVSTYIVAAFDPDIADSNGGYLEDCHVRSPRLAYSGSLEGAHKLWTLSEKLIGEEFDIFKEK